MIKITTTNRNTAEKKEYQLAKKEVTIGRHTDCDVILASTSVSRHHAKISINKNVIEVEDLGSGNGTLLNQAKLTPKEKSPVIAGDILRIEEFDIAIEPQVESVAKGNVVDIDLDDDSVSVSSTMRRKLEITDPDIIEIKMIKKVLGALENEKQPSLQVITGPLAGNKVVFDDSVDEATIGRDPNAHLILDDTSISRKHAVITKKWGSFVVRDLGSKNGTYLNAELIQDERRIKDGDEIIFGTVKTLFKNPLELDFSAISKSISESQQTKAAAEVPAPAPTPPNTPAAEPVQTEKKEEPAPEPQPKESRKSEEQVLQESEEIVPPASAPNTAKPSKKMSFGTLEIALMAGVGFVILIILVFMAMLFM